MPLWPFMPRIRRALAVWGVTALLGVSESALASPATALYQSALNTIQRSYFGWSVADLTALNLKYAAQLAEKCAPTGEACPYDTGRAVLTELLKEFGDAHTNVRDPEGAERLREVTQDLAVQRTGVRVVRVEGGLLVVSVMPGSPAMRQGVRVYDLLTTVNGQDAGKRTGQDAPVGPNEFIRLERTGQPFAVTLRHPRSAERPMTLTTALLKARDVPTLSWAGGDRRTAVITYPSFLSSDASELFLQKIMEAKTRRATQLIVDLRYNGGGSLLECVAAASIFAPVQYKSQYRQGSQVFTGVNGLDGPPFGPAITTTTISPPVWSGRTAVLVGPNTASCAEVFTYFARRAGALAVGEKTKGVGNSGVFFEPLPDGGVLSVTRLKAFTADDQPLPDAIIPDVDAPTDIAALTTQGLDTTLNAALQALSTTATR